ncbi:hypothetical protein SAMN02745121_06982 [Nannocystis exedens]|uniref:Uncharacterized protein n=1 Tax=Nannocystis exedens TaxID=54 RepID=A0A1I2FZW3_9BACT|nr:hypothetical protein [Nannocystis exedens]PCC74617.1 hypothetical protein NAEX_07714 [Nannocystis exedens]SFF10954.1 hypothetical protein SAMN02745121_06982 [Nannocystis exedens]
MDPTTTTKTSDAISPDPEGLNVSEHRGAARPRTYLAAAASGLSLLAGGYAASIHAFGQPAADEQAVGFTLPETLPLYTDKTPICHYLERGIDDFKAGQADWHTITAAEVKTLADIEELTLGLDAPYTHCRDNPRSIPCSDEDVSKAFCVEQLSLRVGGVLLYDQVAPANQCVMDVGSGLYGMRTISGSKLRSNPRWGFTAAELESWFKYVEVGPDGEFNFKLPGIAFSAELLARTVEGIVGDWLAREAKGCAQNGTLAYDDNPYCGNRRGTLSHSILFFADDGVDCDLGNCPPKSARRSSPWVETEGRAKSVHFDLDIEALKGAADPQDCVKDPFSLKLWCGTKYTDRGQGSVEFDLGLTCDIGLIAGTLAGKSYKYAPCADDAPLHPARRCWKIEAATPASKRAHLRCPAGDTSKACGMKTTQFRSYYDVKTSVSDLRIDAEGGLYYLYALVFKCLFGAACDPDDVATDMLSGAVDASLLQQTYFSGLEGCPAVSYEPDGAIVVDLQPLDICPPGSPDPHCATKLGYDGQGSKLVGDASASPHDVAAAPASVAPTEFWLAASGSAPRLARDRFPELVRFVRARAAAKKSGYAAAATATATPTERFRMDEIDGALTAMCAAAPACSPNLDIAEIPLAELAAVDFDAVRATLDGPCLPGEAPAVCEQRKLLAVQAKIGFLLDNDEFKDNCVGYSYPGQTTSLLQYYRAAAQWFSEKLLPAYEKTGPTSCRAQAKIETLFPAMGIELRVKTREDVSDTFPFVNLRDNDSPAVASLRPSLRCAHLRATELESSKAPACGTNGVLAKGPGAAEKHECGTVAGGACADFREAEIGVASLESPQFHPNGDSAWWARCGHDVDSGRPMTCVDSFYPGAAPNVAGTCKICGTPDEGEDPNLFTMIGCRPQNGSCPYGLAEFPDGLCWSESAGPPAWMCEADCEAIYNGHGYCVHDTSWRAWAKKRFPEYATHPDEYARPICADFDSCPNSGTGCASRGMACNPATSACDFECFEDSDCESPLPAPAYPADFVCDDNRCVHKFTAK